MHCDKNNVEENSRVPNGVQVYKNRVYICINTWNGQNMPKD